MIPINLIRQYYFCPRIVYFNLLTDIKPIFPKHIELGNDYHLLQYQLTKNRKFKKLKIDYEKILTEFYLENKELNINGIVDLAFICKDEIIPVEYKFIENKPSFAYILQTVGYGILLEKEFKKPFKRGFIIYSNNIKFYQIILDEKLKNNFSKTLKNIEKILENGILPNSSASEAKCSQCEYLNYCDDRI